MSIPSQRAPCTLDTKLLKIALINNLGKLLCESTQGALQLKYASFAYGREIVRIRSVIRAPNFSIRFYPLIPLISKERKQC